MRRKKILMAQHFLRNQTVLNKIVHCIAPSNQDLIIEIGAGKGALTFPLARRAGHIIAVENDKHLIPFLRKKEFQNLEILEEDILKVYFHQLVKEKKKSFTYVKLVGNLPYVISSPILFKLFNEKELFHRCVFLLQKEVAERLCAKPGTKKYAPISILFQIYYEIRLHFTVKPESFSPPPRVESALVSLQQRGKPLYFLEKEEEFRQFLRDVFQHRRKTLSNNLRRLGYQHSQLKKIFLEHNLEYNLRPEQLTIGQFVELFTVLK